MIKRIFYFFLFLALTGCGGPVDSNQAYDQKIKKAQKALEKNYNNPKTHTYLGVLYEKRGLTSQAEKHYRIAIELDPHFTEALINLGNLYFKEKDLPGSIQTLQKGVESNPTDPTVHYLLATVYKEDQQYQQALTHYQKVLQLDPKYILAQNSVGVISYELKEFEKAEEAFNQTLNLDPHFADAYGNLGILYDFNFHDKEKAVGYYEKFLSLKSDGENVTLIHELLNKARFELEKVRQAQEDQRNKQEDIHKIQLLLEEGKALLKQEKFEEAKTKLRAYLETRPKDVEGKIQWAILISKTGSASEAIKVLKETIKKSEGSADLWYELAHVYDREGAHEAIQTYEEVLRLAPEDARAQSARARLEALKAPSHTPPLDSSSSSPVVIVKSPTVLSAEGGSPPNNWRAGASGGKGVAPHETRKVMQDGAAQSMFHFNQGVSYQSKGQQPQAIAEYQKSIRLNSSNVKAHFNLGILYKWKGDYASAIREYQEVISLDPGFAKAYYNLGIILKTQGRDDEAIAQFKKAIKIDPRYSDAYLGLGLLCSQRNEELQYAITCYKKYLELNPSGPSAAKIRTWLHSIGEDG